MGIANDGRVVGIDDIEQVQLQIKDRIKNNISPSCMGLFDVVTEIQSARGHY